MVRARAMKGTKQGRLTRVERRCRIFLVAVGFLCWTDCIEEVCIHSPQCFYSLLVSVSPGERWALERVRAGDTPSAYRGNKRGGCHIWCWGVARGMPRNVIGRAVTSMKKKSTETHGPPSSTLPAFSLHPTLSLRPPLPEGDPYLSRPVCRRTAPRATTQRPPCHHF